AAEPVDRVGPVLAVDLVGARCAVQHVVGAGAYERVGEGRAAQGEQRGAADRRHDGGAPHRWLKTPLATEVARSLLVAGLAGHDHARLLAVHHHARLPGPALAPARPLEG